MGPAMNVENLGEPQEDGVDSPLRHLDPPTLRTSVTESIRDAILHGYVPQGEKLNQARIATRLGVSRGPVREALRELEEEGLVASVPHKGTFVTELGPGYIEELYGLRVLLEKYAVERACDFATDDELMQLKRILEAMQEAAGWGDPREVAELDLQFHHTIVLSAHNRVLLQIWKTIEVGVRRLVILQHSKFRRLGDVVRDHPDVLNAMEARDAGLAGSLLVNHIREAGEYLYAAYRARDSASPDGSERRERPGTE